MLKKCNISKNNSQFRKREESACPLTSFAAGKCRHLWCNVVFTLERRYRYT